MSDNEAPSWYSCESWESATIDLSDFGMGAAHIVDATAERKYQWYQAAQKDALAAETTAKLLAAYVEGGDMAAGFPARSAKWEKWLEWMRTQRAKPVERLTQGIMRFMSDSTAKAEDAPKS